MSMQFVVIDETNGATTTSGEKLDANTLAMCCRIFTIYLNRLVGSYWGIAGGAAVRAASGPSDILTGEWPSHVQPTLPNAPDAVAYHDWMNGKADIYDGIKNSDNLLGPGGWTTAMTHEFGETVADVETNIMRRDNAGHLDDQEICDPVETQSFPMTVDKDGNLLDTPNTQPGFAPDGSFTCYVANFVTEQYFTPASPGPFDYMTAAGLPGASRPTAPFTPVPSGGGNYQMLETDPQDDSQVTAMRKEGGRKHVLGSTKYRQAHKAHFTSRPYRRGLRVPMPPPVPEAPPKKETPSGDVETMPAELAGLLESSVVEPLAPPMSQPPPAADSSATSVRNILDELTEEARKIGLYNPPEAPPAAGGGALAEAAPVVSEAPVAQPVQQQEETKSDDWQETPL